jgi:hypothetical protein
MHEAPAEERRFDKTGPQDKFEELLPQQIASLIA